MKGGLTPLDSLVYVVKDPDADTDTVREEIEGVVKDLPTVTVKDPEGYAAEQKTQINQFLAFIYGLLGLSVVIAILGVINTLSLSVIERTREVGLLRAVGVSRRQLRTMIRLEAVVIAVFGAVLGVGHGRRVRLGSGPGAARRRSHRPGDPVVGAGRLRRRIGAPGSARGGFPGPKGCQARRTSCHYVRVGQGGAVRVIPALLRTGLQ